MTGKHACIVQIAGKIIKYIDKQGTTTYDAIIARGTELGIPIGVLDNALQLAHKNPRVSHKNSTYTMKVEKPKTSFDILAEWSKTNP